MFQGYLWSVVLGVVGSMAITLIWSRFKGLPTIITWAVGGVLGAAAWWAHGQFDGALEVILSLLFAGGFMAIIDWHRRVTPD